ncbi:MAG: TerB family tellurite resistance protein [Flavobacteriaceae bacterium]|nr:TerB family tellurite resistance protein [Flavobacteriaceae bacterium]
MSISDLYSSGAHKRDLGHFANIVKLALADDIITEGEQRLLDRMARRLEISEDEYKNILKNPEKYPTNPPVDYDKRIERLYNLTKMIFVDNEVVGNEASVMRKIAIGLGFPTDNAEKVVDEAIHLTMNDNDLEGFTKAVKRVNKI